ncbi:hypothetical protein IBX76_07655 [Neisseria gonorrhoeae]|uniref:hypothetical protein n=1 Tax=Neisseria gonorrhoeae TaxID=485 RepID=UPI00177F3AE4|nr:hypothetical protein [Neisseria gonorrhoeae]QOG39002.1 hypothetical protein IBX76_07655 [Neisseria gonorrhoeae]
MDSMKTVNGGLKPTDSSTPTFTMLPTVSKPVISDNTAILKFVIPDNTAISKPVIPAQAGIQTPDAAGIYRK